MSRSSKTSIPFDPIYRVTFHPRHATIIPKPYRKGSRLLNLNNRSASGGLIVMHEGRVSPNSARKIRQAIDWLDASAGVKYLYSKESNKFYPWRLSFATFTLPAQGAKSDKEIKAIFNSWLQMAKYKFGLRSYIWKAEPQARGTIHIHLTSDCFIWHKALRFTWNRLLKRHGLLNGHEDPNSTDIHSTYKVKNLAAYLAKYFCKDSPNRRKIGGRLWGASHTLAAGRGIRAEFRASSLEGERASLFELAKSYRCGDYYEAYYMKTGYLDRVANGKLRAIYKARKRQIRKRDDPRQYEIYDNETGEQLNLKP